MLRNTPNTPGDKLKGIGPYKTLILHYIGLKEVKDTKSLFSYFQEELESARNTLEPLK